ncbi:MAG: polysaccharide deacetylase family protein [Planctomycetaceae bacterium]
MDRFANWFLAVSIVVALIAGANYLRPAWELPGDRYLLIHADDAGLCAAANRATIAALERGAVTSASIMVPCPGFEDFAYFARSNPQRDFGVHVTLTSEWDGVRWGPLTDPAIVPSLVNADGTFWRSADEFAEHAIASEVEIEVRAQIRRAQEREIVLSHLDNHMNSLFRRPDLIELFVRISLDEELPIRFGKSLPDGWDAVLPAAVVDAYYAQLKVLYLHRNPLADHIEADNYQVRPGDKRAYLLHALRRLGPGVTELVVHCCDVDGGDWRPPDAAGRHAETLTLTSPEFAAEIDTLGINLIDWQDFRRMTRGSKRETW